MWYNAAHVLEDWHGSRTLRSLIKQASDDGASGQAVKRFNTALWNKAILPSCNHWTQSTHANKVHGPRLLNGLMIDVVSVGLYGWKGVCGRLLQS